MARRYTTFVVRPISGFTLMELLVVVTIIGIMAMSAMITIKPWLLVARARDTQRRSDIKLIAGALESFADDQVCYPTDDLVNVCGGDGLKPYLNRIPCDPLTKQFYQYVRPDNCKQYVLYAKMEIDEGLPDYGGLGNYAITGGSMLILP